MEAVIFPRKWYKAILVEIIEKESIVSKRMLLNLRFLVGKKVIVNHYISKDLPTLLLPIVIGCGMKTNQFKPFEVDLNKLIGREVKVFIEMHRYNDMEYPKISRFKKV